MADIACIVATLLFFLSNCLRIAFVSQFGAAQQESFRFEDWKEFDTDVLKRQWEWRMDNKSLDMAAGIMNAMAWFIFAIPILHVVWIQQQYQQTPTRKTSLHTTIALLAVGGATTEFLSRLMNIGSTNTMEWIVNDFNLSNWLGGETDDDLGWKALEVVFMAVQGFLLWVDAAEWLFLSLIFLLVFFSIRRKPQGLRRLFSIQWGAFGLVVSFMCLLDFAADVLRFKSWLTFTSVAMITSIINRLILFPIWLIWLSRQIPKADASLVSTRARSTPETAKLTGTAAPAPTLQDIPDPYEVAISKNDNVGDGNDDDTRAVI